MGPALLEMAGPGEGIPCLPAQLLTPPHGLPPTGDLLLTGEHSVRILFHLSNSARQKGTGPHCRLPPRDRPCAKAARTKFPPEALSVRGDRSSGSGRGPLRAGPSGRSGRGLSPPEPSRAGPGRHAEQRPPRERLPSVRASLRSFLPAGLPSVPSLSSSRAPPPARPAPRTYRRRSGDVTGHSQWEGEERGLAGFESRGRRMAVGAGAAAGRAGASPERPRARPGERQSEPGTAEGTARKDSAARSDRVLAVRLGSRRNDSSQGRRCLQPRQSGGPCPAREPERKAGQLQQGGACH
ncbi:uncharacterized protein [Taeniopygia guttata]|uniref:uncharacterized protein n=1 Tax=Taeniopygia guttata TaxID=59729 RepID=UPI003BB8B3BB